MRSTDVLETLAELFVTHGVQPTSARTTARRASCAMNCSWALAKGKPKEAVPEHDQVLHVTWDRGQCNSKRRVLVLSPQHPLYIEDLMSAPPPDTTAP